MLTFSSKFGSDVDTRHSSSIFWKHSAAMPGWLHMSTNADRVEDSTHISSMTSMAELVNSCRHSIWYCSIRVKPNSQFHHAARAFTALTLGRWEGHPACEKFSTAIFNVFPFVFWLIGLLNCKSPGEAKEPLEIAGSRSFTGWMPPFLSSNQHHSIHQSME